MTLEQILAWLKMQMMSQAEIEKQNRWREKEAMDLNRAIPRGPDGNILKQGLGGQFSDSLPFTLEDYLRMQKPGLMEQMQKPPQPPQWFQPKGPGII